MGPGGAPRATCDVTPATPTLLTPDEHIMASHPIEVELDADAHDAEDPWQRASAALNSAASQAASAAWSLGSAFVALAEAGAAATTAAAAASYQAAQPSIQAGKAAAGEAWTQGFSWSAEALAQLAHKDSAPIPLFFFVALATLRICLWLCGGLRLHGLGCVAWSCGYASRSSARLRAAMVSIAIQK